MKKLDYEYWKDTGGMFSYVLVGISVVYAFIAEKLGQVFAILLVATIIFAILFCLIKMTVHKYND